MGLGTMSQFPFGVLALLAALALAALLAGCDDQSCWGDCHHCEDNQAPAVPTGVASITGDTYVVVYWNPVYEEDLGGYGVYRSNSATGAYARIGEVRWNEEATFTDEDLANGVTYYYAVDAFDEAGNESDLSYERRWCSWLSPTPMRSTTLTLMSPTACASCHARASTESGT
jgi:hypothetical protein